MACVGAAFWDAYLAHSSSSVFFKLDISACIVSRILSVCCQTDELSKCALAFLVFGEARFCVAAESFFRARLKVQMRFIEKDKLVLRNLRRRNEQVHQPTNNAASI